MGFEQLAALKAQLTKEAAQKSAEKSAQKAAPRSAKPSSKPSDKRLTERSTARSTERSAEVSTRPSAKPSSEPSTRPSAKPPRAPRPAPAAKSKPVDPVVLTFARLQKRFPLAFPKNPAPKVPLKVGIFEDLLAHAQELSVDETGLRDALRTWCRGSRYWACMVEGTMRVDLEGKEAGQVTRSDAVRALALKNGRAARPPRKDPKDAADSKEAAKDVNTDVNQEAAKETEVASSKPETAETSESQTGA